MVRFYLRLFRDAPRHLWRALGVVLTMIGAAILVLALLNREWAEDVAGWQGFSPWWVVAGIVVLFVYLVMRSNYLAFTDADQQAQRQAQTEAELNAARGQIDLMQQRIDQWKKAYEVSQAQYRVFDGWYREQGWRGPAEQPAAPQPPAA